MKISTRQDLATAAIAITNGTVSPDDLEFSEYITDTIKIYSDNFQNTKNLDYRTSELMIAVQKDVLGIYNMIFNTKISLKNIDKYDFLIVKFSIDDGCLTFISKFAKKVFEQICKEVEEIPIVKEFFKDMTPKQKLVALFLLMAFAGIWKADNIIRAIRENPELADVIEHNEKISEGLTRNQKTQVVIINNLGEGYVEYNDSTYDADDYKDGIIKYQNHNDIIPVYIDDMFLILQYDFENQKIQLIQRGQEPFWASTEWLGHEERSRLKEITSLSIEQQTVALKMIHLSCKIKNGKVQEAVVQRLEQSARTESKKFADAIQMDIQPKPSMPEQHSLLDMIENSED